jgi:hypothetical protein
VSTPKQISREEMQRLLDERCPNASELVRYAALSGSPFTIDGETYQCPDTFDIRESPCRIPALITKVGDEWIYN